MLSRYIFKELLKYVTIITISLTSISLLSSSLRGIKDGNLTNLLYIFYLAPYFLYIILPIAIFIAIIIAFIKFENDSELIAIRAVGVPNLGIIRPILSMAIILTLIGLICSNFISPLAYNRFKQKTDGAIENFFQTNLQGGEFLVVRNVTIYNSAKNEDNELLDLFIYDARNPKESQIIFAEKGVLSVDHNNLRLDLDQGSYNKVDRQNKLHLIDFENLNYQLKDESQADAKRIRDTNSFRLFKQINEPGSPRDKIYAELQQRLNWPVLAMPLSLFGFLPFVRTIPRKSNKWLKISISSIISIILIVSLAFLNSINFNEKIAIYAYSMLLITFFITLWQLIKPTRRELN